MDEIKRKLALIDRQLAGGKFHEQAVSTCPLVFVTVGLVAGILAQGSLGLSVSVWRSVLGFLAAMTFLVFILQRSFAGDYRYAAAYLAAACFACLGAVRLAYYQNSAANDIRHCVTDQRKLAAIRGRVLTEPYVNEYPGWKFAHFRPVDPASSFYLKATEVQTTSGWAPVTGTVRVQVDEPVDDLEVGNNIEAFCWLDRFKPPTNPGQFDTAGYLARRNVLIGASVKSRAGIRLLPGSASATWSRLRIRASRMATTALLGDIDPQEDVRGMLQALLLGNRRNISSETYRAFRRTGLLHFVSLSGMHLGILFGMVWWVCKTAGLMKPARALICAISIGVFMLIVPPRAPTIRAALICWLFCASILFRRCSNPLNTLSLSAIILLLIMPTQLFEAGWQLSFACVLAIILFAKRIESFISTATAQANRRFRLLDTARLFIVRLFAAGLSAWLGAAGILLYHFYAITPLAGIWTVLVFPLVCAILVVGFVKMMLFCLLPVLSGLLGIPAALLCASLIGTVEWIDRMGVSQILVGRVPLELIIFYYCAIAFAAYGYLRRPLVKKLICILMFLSIIVYLGTSKWQRAYRDDLVLTCLDVGHGQAVLLQLPGGTSILFDAGSLYKRDIGTRIVAPFLDYHGIDRIEAIIISHNDADHINGIPEVVGHCRVGGVYANAALFGTTDEWGTIEFLRKSLCEYDLEIADLDGCVGSSGVNIRTLWPNQNLTGVNDLSDNNRSLVSAIEFAGVTILLCSDIERVAQAGLLRLHPNLTADVVVVPHHGSPRTLDPTFLESLNARVLICSCDQTQLARTAHRSEPAADVLPNAQKFFTARDGAVTLTVHKDGVIETATFVK